CLFPAHRAVSRDVRLKPLWGENSMYAYVKWLVVAQLWIVYTFAAIAKLYPDWFDLSFVSQLMAPKAGYPIIGELLQQPWVHRGVVWFGIGYDFLVIPLLLWRPTRMFAFGASVFFHLFNAVVIQVGIFPFLSLALMVFFFDPELVRRRFFPKKPAPQPREFRIPKGAAAIVWGMGLYLALQLALPLRHHLIKGDVLWTEEGHRLSWRMMLRTRQGDLRFRVEDLRTGFKEAVRLDDYLTPDQKEKVMAYPDFIWQFARRLKEKYAAEGHEVAVYARGRLRINRRPFYPFIDETVDLASEPWDPLRHHRWILPEPTGWPGQAAESPEAP
ncbi:MAG TPA: HTTM domain-containing protein, partial [Robiginitalea sp.]|nr:HTTM domain-containing protein [Robiginitalea sp.]